MKKTIMILGASILQMPAIIKAKSLGYKVVVVDQNPQAKGFEVEGIQKELISTIDTSEILKVAEYHEIDGIMTLATDLPMQTVARVAKDRGLIGISVETALKTTNKAVMREALRCAKVPIPDYYVVHSEEEFVRSVEAINVQNKMCISKPADSSGSKGIFLIDITSNPDLHEIYTFTKSYSHSGLVVVEEYMQGPEVSVETFTVEGEVCVVQITDKVTSGPPHFVERGHSQPSQLDANIKEQICELAISANHALGIDNGPSHTEIIVTNDGPKIVEVGARLGGDNITTHLVPLSTGIDLVELCIKCAMDEKFEIKPTLNKGAAIRYFEKGTGKIRKISGLHSALSCSGVKEIYFNYSEGDTVPEMTNSGNRLGFVIAQGDNVQEALGTCREVEARLEVEFEARESL